jgi:hypothetical protein
LAASLIEPNSSVFIAYFSCLVFGIVKLLLLTPFCVISKAYKVSQAIESLSVKSQLMFWQTKTVVLNLFSDNEDTAVFLVKIRQRLG